MTVIYGAEEEARPVGRSLARGGLSCCPACGKGPMFAGFIKVRDHCPDCGEALHHQRADDAPPYITIAIVGHVVVALQLWAEVAYTPPLWLHAAIFLPMATVMSLALLRPIKGALVGLQWALRMHGFESRETDAGR